MAKHLKIHIKIYIMYSNKLFCKKMEISLQVSKQTNDIKYISNFISGSCDCTHCYQLKKKYNKIEMIYNHYNVQQNHKMDSSRYGSILDHNSTIYLNNNIYPLSDFLKKKYCVNQLMLSPQHDYYINRFYHINNHSSNSKNPENI